MKKQIGLFTAILFAVSTLMVSCSPEVHEHTFAEEWSSDETNHWHAATCEHNEEKSELAEHRFGDWIERVVPTEYTEGWQERFCIECGYREVNDVPRLEHVHSFSEEWTSDSTYHWHAAICEHGDVQGDIAEHSFGEWSMTVLPTEDTEGLQERYCTECGFKDEEKLEKLEHVHSFSETLSYDESYHWYELMCGCDDVDVSRNNHSYGDWEVSSDGVKYRLCLDCSYKDVLVGNVQSVEVRIGDFVSKDGFLIKKEYVSDLSEYEKSNIFGIIIQIEGKKYILGTKKSEAKLKWAPTGTVGYETYFPDIYVKYETEVFSGDLNGNDNWEYICSVDKEASDTAITNYQVFNFANDYARRVGLIGTRYENGWYIPSIKELSGIKENLNTINSLLNAIDINLSRGIFWSSSQSDKGCEYAYALDFYYSELSSELKSNSNDVLVIKDFSPQLFDHYNYGVPSILSVDIPTVGEGYRQSVVVTVKGEGLLSDKIFVEGNGITMDEIICTDNHNAFVIISCENTIDGEYPVTVKCGSAVFSSTLKVDSFSAYEVGDIILEDGSKVSVNDTYEIDENNKPVGVIAITHNEWGGVVIPKIIGLKNGYRRWSYYTGYENYSFDEIQCTVYPNSHYIFLGDTDGSDNWDYIHSIAPNSSFPVFEFAENYVENADLIETKFADDWYIPSIDELYQISKNLAILESSLAKVDGFSLQNSNSYWSSSIAPSGYPYCCSFHHENSSFGSIYMQNENHVFVLHSINE